MSRLVAFAALSGAALLSSFHLPDDALVTPVLAAASTGASAASGSAADPLASPIFGVTLPPDYRNWPVIAPSHEEGFGELRVIVGNPIAMKAFKDGALPFPDGTVMTKIAWERVQSTEFAPAYIPGKAKTVQVMVKDARRYASTGGWGFGRFIDGKPVDAAQHQTCFACHQANVKDHDFVFTRLGAGL